MSCTCFFCQFVTCMRSLLRTMQCCPGCCCKLCETIAIALAICSRFIVFALASTWRCHGHNCKSVEGITIAQVIHKREMTSRLLFANFAVSLWSLWQFAESSRSPFAIWRNCCDRFCNSQQFHHGRFLQAHSIVAIASVICGIICSRILRHAGSSQSPFCKVVDTLQSLLQGCGKKESMALKRLGGRGGRHRVLRDFLRAVLVDLGTEACGASSILEGHLGGSWDRRLEAKTEFQGTSWGRSWSASVGLEGQTSRMEA